MMFKALLAFSLLPLAFSSPQDYGGPVAAPPPATTSSAAASPSSSDIVVQVGSGSTGIAFNPSDIQAPVGHTVTFSFQAIQLLSRRFADPCTPISQTQNGTTGFDSGLTQGTTFTVNITDASTPVYFFCKFPTHCGLGMVGSINAPSSGNGSFASYQSAAMAIGSNEKTIPDSGPQTGGVGAVATAGPQTGTPTDAGSAPANTGSSGAAQLSINGVMALLSLGAVVAFTL
ncbi:hypothetical protein EW026_g6797 [Hermanssonia centrifuga]|uniref:Blue (type 1) copper domain-containing protein n=1 Tax=Hermanssonia centrifuga TaxID=98765 RepID=A0A4S4K9V8_9APHY|nr:hypothetical protein EW026_g6797 [Hermanssonia centrifuga]